MTEQATIAGLIALALGLVKVIEKLVEWGLKKRANGRAEGDAPGPASTSDVGRTVHEIYGRVASIDGIVCLRDQDGTPMVYTPRHLGDGMRQVAQLLRDAAHVQERILEKFDSLDEKVEDVRLSVRKRPRVG